MDRFGVQMSLERIALQRSEWDAANKTFEARVETVMTRLIYEAVVNRLSIEQIATMSGLSTKRVRRLMRESGLDPKQGRGVLSQAAATALQENAALLDIDPLQMDLTSPLAYLPMGQELRKTLSNGVIRAADSRCAQPGSDHGWCNEPRPCPKHERADDADARAVAHFLAAVSEWSRKLSGAGHDELLVIACSWFGIKPEWVYGPEGEGVIELEAEVAKFVTLHGPTIDQGCPHSGCTICRDTTS